eukprot:13545075-Heterocapsa_arctica.AAC.1
MPEVFGGRGGLLGRAVPGGAWPAFFTGGGLEGAPGACVLVMSAISHGLGGGDRDVVSLWVEVGRSVDSKFVLPWVRGWEWWSEGKGVP